jgi:hypothetical protein
VREWSSPGTSALPRGSSAWLSSCLRAGDAPCMSKLLPGEMPLFLHTTHTHTHSLTHTHTLTHSHTHTHTHTHTLTHHMAFQRGCLVSSTDSSLIASISSKLQQNCDESEHHKVSTSKK